MIPVSLGLFYERGLEVDVTFLLHENLNTSFEDHRASSWMVNLDPPIAVYTLERTVVHREVTPVPYNSGTREKFSTSVFFYLYIPWLSPCEKTLWAAVPMIVLWIPVLIQLI